MNKLNHVLYKACKYVQSFYFIFEEWYPSEELPY